MKTNFNVCNTDLLQPNKFIFSIPRLIETQFFCQNVNLPGIQSDQEVQSTPFVNLPLPGNKLTYNPLTISFLVDEELKSWLSIHNWLTGLTNPQNFDQYKNLKNQTQFSFLKDKDPQYADAELIILSSNNVPKIKISFVDTFPTSLSGLDFDVKLSSENIITATSTFLYKYYTITVI